MLLVPTPEIGYEFVVDYGYSVTEKDKPALMQNGYFTQKFTVKSLQSTYIVREILEVFPALDKEENGQIISTPESAFVLLEIKKF